VNCGKGRKPGDREDRRGKVNRSSDGHLFRQILLCALGRETVTKEHCNQGVDRPDIEPSVPGLTINITPKKQRGLAENRPPPDLLAVDQRGPQRHGSVANDCKDRAEVRQRHVKQRCYEGKSLPRLRHRTGWRTSFQSRRLSRRCIAAKAPPKHSRSMRIEDHTTQK